MSFHEEFISMVRKFANNELKDLAVEMDEQEQINPFVLEKLNEYGFTSMHIPEEHGGVGAKLDLICQVVEELAKVCASTAITLVGHLTGSIACNILGTEEQKEKYLYPKDGKQNVFAICISEPGAGSDVSSISTTAVKKDDGYVLNGTKQFVTNGGLADIYVVVARTNKDDRKGGLSAFVIPKDTEGLVVGKKEKKMGLRGSHTTDIYLDQCWVPEDQLLGNEGDGFKLIEKTMDQTRVVVAAHALGIAEGALEYALGYSNERKQFGKKINEFQGIKFMLADMAIELESAKSIVYYAAEQVMKQNPIASYYSSIAKAKASNTAMAVTTDAVQILGGAGYIREHPVERMMRDAKITQIFEGTNQIQKTIIAKHLIKNLTI